MIGTELETFRDKCASVINTEWKYSWHWGKHPKERHWTMDALHDAKRRLADAEKDVLRLKQVHSQLSEESKLHYPEDLS